MKPEIPGRRERKKEAVRKRILDRAMDLFKKDGFDNVTMEGIAESAIEENVFPMSFKNKDIDIEFNEIVFIGSDNLLPAFAREHTKHDTSVEFYFMFDEGVNFKFPYFH